MQKVVSISLNGNSYQLEEPGFDQLRAYLERAEARLEDSPDRAEVMADLEQAISEKCRATLGPHKTVVNTTEIDFVQNRPEADDLAAVIQKTKAGVSHYNPLGSR